MPICEYCREERVESGVITDLDDDIVCLQCLRFLNETYGYSLRMSILTIKLSLGEIFKPVFVKIDNFLTKILEKMDR